MSQKGMSFFKAYLTSTYLLSYSYSWKIDSGYLRSIVNLRMIYPQSSYFLKLLATYLYVCTYSYNLAVSEVQKYSEKKKNLNKSW